MNRKFPLRYYIGFIFLLATIVINLYVALRYYDISTRKLPDFYIWQTNTEKKDSR